MYSTFLYSRQVVPPVGILFNLILGCFVSVDSTESLVGCAEVIVLNPSPSDRVVLIHSDSTQPSFVGQVVPITVIGTQPSLS